MDYVQIVTTLGSAVTVIYAIKSSFDKKFDAIDKKFDGIHSEIKEVRSEIREVRKEINSVSDRISKVEGEMDTIRSMLHALIGGLLSQKTGTDGKDH